MNARAEPAGAPLSTALGAAVGFAGLGLLGVGIWARRDVARTLAEERVLVPVNTQQPGARLANATAARATAELIRRSTAEATEGRAYAETEPYIDPDGKPTPDAVLALKDPRTGRPVENPDHELWIQSITLQTALMQAYLAFRLSELTIALGSAFVGVGLGLAAVGRRVSRP